MSIKQLLPPPPVTTPLIEVPRDAANIRLGNLGVANREGISPRQPTTYETGEHRKILNQK